MPSESLALGSFLKEEDLVHLHDVLESHGGLAELASMLSANRVLFLARLKEWGVSRLVERQRVANGLARAIKAGRVGTVAATPHLAPCTWTQTDDCLVARLAIPAGTPSSAVAVSFEVNAMDIRVHGEASSMCGRLHGVVKPSDCTWELERAPPAEPAMFELRADQQPHDEVVVTLAKGKAGAEWGGLFASGVGMSSKREKPPPPPEKPKPAPPPPRAGGGVGGVGFVQRKLKLGERGGGNGGGGGEARGGARSGKAVRSLPARDHWEGERARYVWRTGCGQLRCETESPPPVEGHGAESGGGPLFWWRETAAEVVLTARTRRGIDLSSLRLDAREAQRRQRQRRQRCPSADTRAGVWGLGVARPRGGRHPLPVERRPLRPRPPRGLLRRGAASGTGLRGGPLSAAAHGGEGGRGAFGAVLARALPRPAPARRGARAARRARAPRLAATHARLWLAERPDLGRVRGADAALCRRLHGRGARRPTPGPGPTPPAHARDTCAASRRQDADRLLRVAVTVRSVSVHVAGQPDAPLLAGETHGKLLVGGCSWRLARSKVRGWRGEPLQQLELHLAKDTASAGPGGHWPDLFSTEYS